MDKNDADMVLLVEIDGAEGSFGEIDATGCDTLVDVTNKGFGDFDTNGGLSFCLNS